MTAVLPLPKKLVLTTPSSGSPAKVPFTGAPPPFFRRTNWPPEAGPKPPNEATLSAAPPRVTAPAPATLALTTRSLTGGPLATLKFQLPPLRLRKPLTVAGAAALLLTTSALSDRVSSVVTVPPVRLSDATPSFAWPSRVTALAHW